MLKLSLVLTLVAVFMVTFAGSCVTYSIDPGVSQADQVRIKNGIDWATAYLDAHFEGHRQAPVVVVMNDSPEKCFGQTGGAFGQTKNVICLNTANSNWRGQEEKTTAHEYFHTLQFEMGCLSPPSPLWLQEGTAEYIAYEIAIANGRYSRAFVDAERINGIADNRASIGTLREQEGTTISQANSYKLYAYAVGVLTRGPGFISYRRFCEKLSAGEDWHAAFVDAFGVSVDAFYNQIDQQVAALKDVPPVAP
ncbi:MAG: hypothetical protein ACYDEB_01865 [Dehalococcoidia bacterium]